MSHPSNGHYTPDQYGIDPTCTFCGLKIQDDEDWEGREDVGASHRSPPKGCVKALARELLALKVGD